MWQSVWLLIEGRIAYVTGYAESFSKTEFTPQPANRYGTA